VSASLSLTLANRMDEVPRLVALLESFGARAGLSDDLTFRLTVTIDEAITNIIEHAYDDAASHDIGLSVTWDGAALTAVIEDDGRSFDPRQVPRPDVNAPLDERKSGGLGVYLVRTLVQDVDYRRAGSRNVLTLTLSDEGHGPPQDGHYGGRSA
jgi:anti-sigma regulatory factor (Ser/Thr protein kinase)